MAGPAAPSRTSPPTHLWFTEDEAACALIARDPNAFLIGYILDQQVTVQKAFRGPLDLRTRIGTLDPARIAAMPLDELEAAFREKPALHRFPAANAKRVQDAMRIVSERYGGDAGRIWWEADGLEDLESRLAELPGFAAGKILGTVSTLALRFGVPVTGWESRVPEYGALGQVDSLDALAAYQLRKRAVKAAAKAAAKRSVEGSTGPS